MRRFLSLFFVCIFSVLCVYTSGASEGKVYSIAGVFNQTSILAGESAVSISYKLKDLKPSGYFSLYVTNYGAGDITQMYVEVSGDGSNWYVAKVFTEGIYTYNLFENFSNTGGALADGKQVTSFTVPVSSYIRFRAYATADLTVTASFSIQ